MFTKTRIGIALLFALTWPRPAHAQLFGLFDDIVALFTGGTRLFRESHVAFETARMTTVTTGAVNATRVVASADRLLVGGIRSTGTGAVAVVAPRIARAPSLSRVARMPGASVSIPYRAGLGPLTIRRAETMPNQALAIREGASTATRTASKWRMSQLAVRNQGKTQVVVRSPTTEFRFGLAGKPHYVKAPTPRSVPTPHTRIGGVNAAAPASLGRQYNMARNTAPTPMTLAQERLVRRFLNRAPAVK